MHSSLAKRTDFANSLPPFILKTYALENLILCDKDDGVCFVWCSLHFNVSIIEDRVPVIRVCCETWNRDDLKWKMTKRKEIWAFLVSQCPSSYLSL